MEKTLAAIDYFYKYEAKFIDELIELVQIPSVSTDEERAQDVFRAAKFLENKLISMGIQNVAIFETARHPIVYGDLLTAGANQPTILVYGHYDVQPEDPIDLWYSDPFKPVKKGDSLIGRGTSDMKGQIYACLASIESILSTGKFPVNIKFIFEGEEEIGSPNLKKFLQDHKELLAADVSLNPDTGMLGKDIPTIVYGLRGLSYFEIYIFGPDHDLHSGAYGGVVHNPAQVLCDLISKMHDADGKVMLPGFYDKVRVLSEAETKKINRITEDENYFRTQTGVPKTWGELGFTHLERLGARPTLEVNGILSGFTGNGAKTIIPSKAMAKVSTRLVPDQDPDSILEMLREFMKKNTPDTVRWEIKQLSSGHASVSDIEIPATRALHKALYTIWGKEPVYRREGGSVPVVADMQRMLGFDSVLTGFGLPDDNIHSPNEKLDLPTWSKGVDALIHFFYLVAKE